MRPFTKIALGVFTTGCTLTAMAQSGPPSNNPTMTDAQIAAVLESANKGEAEAGQLALSKSSNAKVKEFAQMMVDDHTANLQETQNLAASGKMKPQSNPASQMVQSSAMAQKKKLEKLSGADFDKAYIDGQIAMHKDVLKTIDTKLVPSAKEAPTKDLLAKTRPKIEAHLNQAQEIRKGL